MPSSELPWHYIPVWIAITTPSAHLALFVIAYRRHPLAPGDAAWSCGRVTRSCRTLFPRPGLPAIAAVIALHSVLYGGWLHLYFIYPHS